jgi:hypothetical protein
MPTYECPLCGSQLPASRSEAVLQREQEQATTHQATIEKLHHQLYTLQWQISHIQVNLTRVLHGKQPDSLTTSSLQSARRPGESDT